MKPTRERAIAALRAVLDECENFTPPTKYADPTGEILSGMERLAERIRKVTTDALDAKPGDAP